jgi:hypothetical protein
VICQLTFLKIFHQGVNLCVEVFYFIFSRKIKASPFFDMAMQSGLNAW